MILAGELASPMLIQRFRIEAESAARLLMSDDGNYITGEAVNTSGGQTMV